MTETLIYALPAGKTERWHEDLMYGGGRLLTATEIEAVKAAAGAEGWHSFRVTTFTEGEPVDFTKALGS